MKKLLIGIAGFLLASGNGMAFTAEDGFGVGFVLGSPSGLSASLPMGKSNAVNAIVGYSLTGSTNLHVQADYVWYQALSGESGDMILENGRVSFYYGPGAFVQLSGNPVLGIHAITGLDYRFQQAPLQLFLEVGPGINILPNTAINAGAGLGLRYYF